MAIALCLVFVIKMIYIRKKNHIIYNKILFIYAYQIGYGIIACYVFYGVVFVTIMM